MGEVKEVLAKDDAEFEKELDKVGTARGRLRRKLTESDDEMAKMFSEQTEMQKAWGKLIGKIILAKSNDQIEDAFSWWAQEYNGGVQLGNVERITSFFHALASLGCDDAHYRILRRMYVKANTNE